MTLWLCGLFKGPASSRLLRKLFLISKTRSCTTLLNYLFPE
jgi:hypothetical protein